jgi:hypothetical protein
LPNIYYGSNLSIENYNNSNLTPSLLIIKKCRISGCRWFTPVILTTQEAEIRQFEVRSQSQANSSSEPITQKPMTLKGLVEWME